MTSIDAYIYIVIGLLGVAYPVLLQVVARLDEKYSSDKIVELFEKEWESKIFRYSLYSSIALIVIWSLKFPTLIRIEYMNFFIENSASILLATNSILLIIFFFFFVNKILIYYTPSKIIPYLINKTQKSDPEFQYFTALSDLLLLFVRNQQTNYTKTLSDFFYVAFRKIRDKQLNQPIVYPDLYYEVVYKAIEELAILKEKRNYLLEHRTSGEIWLLGELQGKEISQITYSWMWRNLLLAIRYQQDDLIIYHWETCHQYFNHNLSYIFEDFDSPSGNLKIKNQEAINKRLTERQKFIEFHYALGGLLTFKERYACIKRLFNYTQSQPPKYVLLPESMDEIFKFYFEIRDPYERKYPWISHQYSFPDLSGLNADSVIKKWIMSYMGILFLRQYTIFPYLITMRPLDYPVKPKTQGEIKNWIDGLDFFRILVEGHLHNNLLIKALNLSFLTLDWCNENKKLYPLTFIDNLKSDLEKAYHENAFNIPISNEKIEQFENTTKIILESSIKEIQIINNETSIQDIESDKWYVNGQKMLQNKDAFSENPEVHHFEYDSFLASVISKDLKEALGETFIYKKSKTFLLKPEDLFKAIDKLLIDDNFIIVNFGIYLEYFVNQIIVPELTVEKYKNITIYSFKGSQLAENSLFIIKKTDLPQIITKPISEDLIKKYSLKKISNIINLYTSVIDLNHTSEEVYNENKEDKSDDELRKSVLLCIILSTEYRWKKNIDVIQLKQYSEYFQNGIPNKLEDVKIDNDSL